MFARVLIMRWVLNMSDFWFYQSSEYTRVLNMPGLHKAVNLPEYAWILAYDWKCLTACEYAQIWLFFFTCSHCNPLFCWTGGYLFQQSLYSEETWGCFSEETKRGFFYSSWKYLICYMLLTKYFTSKISNLLLTFWNRGGCELWILRCHYKVAKE